MLVLVETTVARSRLLQKMKITTNTAPKMDGNTERKCGKIALNGGMHADGLKGKADERQRESPKPREAHV